MYVAANSIFLQRDQGLPHEHLSQADPEKQSVLIDAIRAEGGNMKRIGNKCLCEDRYYGLTSVCGVFFNGKSQDDALSLAESYKKSVTCVLAWHNTSDITIKASRLPVALSMHPSYKIGYS